MKELEVKILDIDKEILIKKLLQIWAKTTFEWYINADFYIKNEWKKLRLRKYWDKNILTYKEKLINQNIMENIEYETCFSDYSKLENILKLIWFNKYWFSYKYRISYNYLDIEYDFDKYQNIPWFVEVESNNEKSLKKWVELLWFQMKDTCILTETKLKEYYWV